MKPIGIIQHEPEVAPGNFEQHLRARARPYRVIRLYAGDPVPSEAALYAGLCSLGGNMSVNDGLPWIEPEIALMRDADRRAIPIIGHCLGGQLLARAFGAAVTRAPHLELGWGRVAAEDIALTREWLGNDGDRIEFFQWHSDAFDLPGLARRMLSSAWCANQAYVIERPGYAHIGMQFHIEMTTELVRLWAADPATVSVADAERRRTGGPAVQSPQEMLANVEMRTELMSRIAARLYDRWLSGVRD